MKKTKSALSVQVVSILITLVMMTTVVIPLGVFGDSSEPASEVTASAATDVVAEDSQGEADEQPEDIPEVTKKETSEEAPAPDSGTETPDEELSSGPDSGSPVAAPVDGGKRRDPKTASKGSSIKPLSGGGDVSSNGDYAYDSRTGTLTIESNAGSMAWRTDTNISNTGNDQDRYDCIDAVVIESGVTDINDSAFKNCTNLESVDFSGCANLQTIGAGAFYGCSELKRVNLRGCTSLTLIGHSTFYGCTQLQDVILPASLLTISNQAFQNCPSIVSVDFSACIKLESVGSTSFSGCSSLESVDFSACTKLRKIEPAAFSNCSKLKSADFSGCISLLSIGANMFSGCSDLESVDFSGCISLQLIDAVAFSGCGKLANVDLSGCTNFTTFGSTVFLNCSSLTNVNLNGCTNLTTISPGSPVFLNCGLKSIDLSVCTNLAQTGSYAFMNSANLTEVTFPASIQSIGPAAFQNCASLDSLRFRGMTPPSTIENGAFQGVASAGIIYCPLSAKADYENMLNTYNASNTNLLGWRVLPFSNDAGLDTVAGETITAAGGTGTDSAPITASIKVDSSVADIKISDIVTSDSNAKPYIYSDSGFSLDEDSPISLTVGTGTHAYIKVEAEDGTLLYYDVTVTRPDITAPVPGYSGTLTTADITQTALTLNWTAAADDATSAANLKYYVYRSAAGNISTLSDCEANGTLLNTGGTMGITTIGVTGLSPNTTYYFNIVVEDQAGNKAVYTTKSEMTKSVSTGGSGDNGGTAGGSGDNGGTAGGSGDNGGTAGDSDDNGGTAGNSGNNGGTVSGFGNSGGKAGNSGNNGTAGGAPKTGDNTNLTLWFLIAALSLAALGTLSIFIWKKRKHSARNDVSA